MLTVGSTDGDETIRAVVHNKSNLAPNDPSLAFKLTPEEGFCWMGEYDITIDELMEGKKNNKSENQFTKARMFIEHILRAGPVPTATILQAAEEQGIAEKTLYRAKSALGVISIKPTGVWCWELPIDAEYTEVYQDTQDGQYSHATQMTTLATLTILPETEADVV